MASEDRELTYGELDAWSDNVAAALHRQGLEKGDRVAITAQNSFVAVASILGSLKVGGVFVPLDPDSPRQRLDAQIAPVSPSAWLTESRLGDLTRELAGDDGESAVLEIDREEGSDDNPCLLPRRTEEGLENLLDPPAVEWGADDPCYVYFTSGSTGRPKPISGRLAAIDHFVRWEIEEFGVGPGTRVSQLTAPTFDAFLRDVFTPLCAGGTVVVPGAPETVLSPDRLAAWLDDEEIQLVHCVPSLFRVLLNADLDEDRFRALRAVLLAGEVLLPSDVQRWSAIFGDRIELVNLYGPSETTMVKLFYRVKPEDAERRSIPIGQPMPGARALVVTEAGEPAPAGTVGEILIRTPYRSLGYLGRDDLTAEVFVPNPLSDDPSDVVYRTGDLGRVLESGDLEFLGRRDQQVKIRGIRVELGEIEDLILGSGKVQEAAVADRRDSDDNRYLAAYVVPDEGADDVVGELRAELAEHLPEALIPSAFVVLEALPKTPTGKVDRKSLPAPEEVEDTSRYEAPRTPTEERLAAQFASVLERPRVGIHDDFFQVGGHSLLAMVLLSRLSSEFDVELPLGMLFESPTVAGLAVRVEELQASSGGVEEGETVSGEIEEGDLDSALENLDELSDEEMDSLLADVAEEA